MHIQYIERSEKDAPCKPWGIKVLLSGSIAEQRRREGSIKVEVRFSRSLPWNYRGFAEDDIVSGRYPAYNRDRYRILTRDVREYAQLL